MTSWKRRVLIVVVLGAALGLGTGAAAAQLKHGAATAGLLLSTRAHASYRNAALTLSRADVNSGSWEDAVGDSGNGPDVSKIEITTDNSGTISFALTFANRTTLGSNDLINVLLDTDLEHEGANQTGEGGIDMVLYGDQAGWGVLKWNGSDYPFVDLPQGSSASFRDGVMTFKVNVTALDSPSVIGFRVITSGSPDARVEEIAPDSILGPNTLTIFELDPGSEAGTPTMDGTLTVGQARAGAPLIATLVFQLDTPESATGPLEGRTNTCKAHIGPKTLRTAVQRSSGIVVSCTWKLPKSSRGKTIKGTVGVSFSSHDWAHLQLAFTRKIH